MRGLGAGKMAQWVKDLPQNGEHRTSDPQNPRKAQ